jgi:DNA processing protein
MKIAPELEAQRQNEDRLLHRLALHLLPGIGPVITRNLISYCGGEEEVFKRKKSALEKIPGIGSDRASLISKHHSFKRAEEELLFIQKNNITPLFYLDKEYPARLKNCYDSPVMMFYKGSASLNPQRIVSIVGTRNITEYGRDILEKLIEDLFPYGVTIISGLAYGVDIHAHKVSLKMEMPTIGVTAHGLDRIYPSLHKSIADRMINHGGILTEYASGTIPDRENFPARNRIVAGMSDAVIVIESAERGGALITADLANDYNRDVFAFPGRINDRFSIGCNELIRQNKAMLTMSAKHIAEMMNWDQQNINAKSQMELFVELNAEEKILVDILKSCGQTPIDVISIESGMPVSKVSTILLKLEFAGILKTMPGKVYSLLNNLSR